MYETVCKSGKGLELLNLWPGMAHLTKSYIKNTSGQA